MNRTKRGTIILFLLAFFLKGYGQTCSITPSSYKVCLGSSVFFTLSTNGIISKVAWAYGDGGTDTLITGTHLYKTPGTYAVSVIVKFTNNTSCTASVIQPIKVFDLPKANFIQNYDTVCTLGLFCVSNSTVLGSSGAPIRKVTFLFGDGAITYGQNTPCHSYSKAGNFIVTLEVEDTNGCVSRIEKPLVVIDFKVSIAVKPLQCGVLQFINSGKFPYANVKRYYWDFGDGTYDSTGASYDTVVHLFRDFSKCPFNVRLYIETTNGCIDQKSVPVCPLYKFNVHLVEDKKKACFRENVFNFTNPYNVAALMVWRYKPEGTMSWQNTLYGTSARYSFPTCGRYIIELQIKPIGNYNALCDTLLYDTVEVLGPHAHIELDTVAPYKVINHYMCRPDTAYFVSPTLYQSKHCRASVKRLWDFGDLRCPQCTTDTKNGINTLSNCRWSKDSLNVKHRYTADSCYHVRLLLIDTITGCMDSDNIDIIVGKPDLSKIKINGSPCVGAVQYVDVSKVIPNCEPEGFWFNKDTICNGMFKTSWTKMPLRNFAYTISKICANNTTVTGFVLKNGSCYDTLYFVRTYPKLHPHFALTATHGCAPFTTTTLVFDTFQPICYKAVWEWGDGSANTVDSPVLNGFIKSQTHTFLKNGLYSITLHLYDSSANNSGCVFDSTFMLGVGFHLGIGSSSLTCNGLVSLSNSVNFYSDPYNPLAPYTPFRGTVKYYYGDNYTDTALAFHYYNTAGKYKIKIVAIDTNGCIDSVEGVVKVNEFHVGFTWTPKILVCGQIVQFIDSSYIKDSTDVLPPDSIVSWLWDFGDQRAKSIERNPAHPYFVNGEFYVKLVVTTWRGCKDSVTIKINIKGPRPLFELLTDSVGCAPYTIKLRNISSDCDQALMHMGDPGKSTFPMKQNDTLTFTYTNPGVYYLYIFGESSFLNPNTGSTITCSSWYPDISNPNAFLVRIVVLAKPPVKFSAPDTICVNTPFSIINTSDKRYAKYQWDFGDTTTQTKLRPDTNTTHTYKYTGTYLIQLRPNYTPPFNQKECPDTFAKKIVVVDLKTSFTMDLSLNPLVKFYNTSVGAQSYLWDFGHPRTGALNNASSFNAEHDYLNDTGLFTICLTAFNTYGCKDSVCQIFHNDNYRLLIVPNVFTINGDALNDAFDIDIHGEAYYDLSIYNRWGGEVYHSQVDGTGNDGINWNGRVKNTGAELPTGEYYFKFTYQFRGEDVKVIKGIVTLIR